MKALRRFLALDRSDKIFLAGCIIVVAATRWCLSFLSYRRMQSWFPTTPASDIPTATELARISWGVRNAARVIPGASCLTQALSGQFILARRGKASQVRIGVARDDEGRFIAHAWLISAGKIVLGGGESDVSRYTPLTDLDWKKP